VLCAVKAALDCGQDLDTLQLHSPLQEGGWILRLARLWVQIWRQNQGRTGSTTEVCTQPGAALAGWTSGLALARSCAA
jgi:hypothetical protein